MTLFLTRTGVAASALALTFASACSGSGGHPRPTAAAPSTDTKALAVVAFAGRENRFSDLKCVDVGSATRVTATAGKAYTLVYYVNRGSRDATLQFADESSGSRSYASPALGKDRALGRASVSGRIFTGSTSLTLTHVGLHGKPLADNGKKFVATYRITCSAAVTTTFSESQPAPKPSHSKKSG